MYHDSLKKVWYGQLDTPRGSQIVIYDAKIPSPPEGRVLFYNAERESFIEYMEEIVCQKLRDLSDEEIAEYKERYEKSWKNAKKQYLATRNNRWSSTPADTGKPQAAEIKSSIASLLKELDESEELECQFD